VGPSTSPKATSGAKPAEHDFGTAVLAGAQRTPREAVQNVPAVPGVAGGDQGMVTASTGRLGRAGVPATGASTNPSPASGNDNEGAR
jgi:hypothetical protein